MLSVSSVKSLYASKKLFDVGVSRGPGEENPYNKYCKIIPETSEVYAVVQYNGRDEAEFTFAKEMFGRLAPSFAMLCVGRWGGPVYDTYLFFDINE